MAGRTIRLSSRYCGALYKEMNSLTYRELEYAQHNSRICALFIKLDGRSPISFSAWQKHISMIKAKINFYWNGASKIVL